jgi:hypothetical protein
MAGGRRLISSRIIRYSAMLGLRRLRYFNDPSARIFAHRKIDGLPFAGEWMSDVLTSMFGRLAVISTIIP